ncbi:MAG: hypothetical protein A2140_03400 [Candidatus Muproteobacteria bacterium RBG_16_62_13]|uniref:Uncharacterized protein n=1 Tax=Candidatus Muproteobacteria bacterium RBG_16_62_13 TaxID=1817756 RepID=A0A1F6T7H2_9PROT|nr:MAG: hypothetical protein A2140_03400 [Candidatus Muproteobacteria bacterium RBG_16_62_13]
MRFMALHKTDRGSVGEVAAYARHRPEQTLLYQLVEQHFPAFVSQLSTEGITLPSSVQREFHIFAYLVHIWGQCKNSPVEDRMLRAMKHFRAIGPCR